MTAQQRFFASPRLAALLIVAVAVATRAVAWWNPVANFDDQFYLLAGEQLLKGHWPYIDVWDRKPLGLFLLYAGIAWIGGGSVLGLNLIATGFAAATAWLIRQIALRFASPAGATLAALSYLLTIPLLGGQTGQSPVFYNLFVAGAALLLVDAADRPELIVRRALGAMLLCGLAMTIKQVGLVEGAYFGLAFLWLLYRSGAKATRLLAIGGVMVLAALLPTVVTLIGYALAGREALDAYVFASFQSIFLKGRWGLSDNLAGLAFFIFLLPLLIMALAGYLDRRRQRSDIRDELLFGWTVAAFASYVIFQQFFDHYLLPVTVPLSVSAATLFDRKSGMLFFLALAAFCLLQPPIRDVSKATASRDEFTRVARAVDEARQGGCIYIGDGPTALYSATGACTVTPYLFPDHLDKIVEAQSVGVDTGRELDRILDARPAVIVTQGRKPHRYSPAYRLFLERVERDYRRVYTGPFEAPSAVQRLFVWQRKDLPQPRKS